MQRMEVAFYLLILIGHLGVFDVLYYHTYRCALHQRPESHWEVYWHTLRHAVYALQFIIVANFRFYGSALLLLAAIYLADIIIAWADVWTETNSRKSQGGLPRGEYVMYIVLSVLVGFYIAFVAQTVWPDRLLPAAIAIHPPAVPALLRWYMTAMGLGAAGYFVRDLWQWKRAGQHVASLETPT